MEPIFFLVKTILTVCLYIVILRLWMQYARVNYYNPLSQFIVKITQPIIAPLRKMIPSVGRFDTATFVILYIVAIIKIVFIFGYGTTAPYWNINYLWFALIAIIHAAGYLLFWLLFFRAILSWITRGQSMADDLLAQLTEPLVAPIRRIVPPLGMIDISFMIVVFVLLFLNICANNIFGNIWYILSY